jgi:hypothetical protein
MEGDTINGELEKKLVERLEKGIYPEMHDSLKPAKMHFSSKSC